jgi:hypothetical protein
MPAKARIIATSQEHQALLRAAAVALVVHILLLFILRPELDLPIDINAQSDLRVLLAPQPLPRDKPESQPTMTPKQDSLAERPTPIEAAPQEQQQVETPTPESVPPITTRLLNQFIETETARQLEHDSESLSAFSDTFAETAPVKRVGPSMTTNIYGEVEVRTTIGGRDVCYLKNNQFSADEWGFNLVMFYACSERAEKKQKFSLE